MSENWTRTRSYMALERAPIWLGNAHPYGFETRIPIHMVLRRAPRRCLLHWEHLKPYGCVLSASAGSRSGCWLRRASVYVRQVQKCWRREGETKRYMFSFAIEMGRIDYESWKVVFLQRQRLKWARVRIHMALKGAPIWLLNARPYGF